MATSNGGEGQSDLAVMGANEYKQKRRLQRILDKRDAVEDKADEADELYVTGQISKHAKNIVILEAVQGYIREIYNLLIEYQATLEEGERNIYWQGRGDPLGVIETETRGNIEFHGLSDILHADRFYTEVWEEPVGARHGPDRTRERHAEYTVPEEVSWNGYLLVNEFLDREHDLEIKFEELGDKLPTWGFEEIPEDEQGADGDADGDGDGDALTNGADTDSDDGPEVI